MATSDCISSRKSQRMKRKAAKMTALVNLSKPLSNEMDTKSTSHEKLIQQLEQQLNDSSDDQSLPYADQGDEDDDYNADTNIYSAYRKLMNKRRKIELSRKVVTIYIDQPFLSLRRRKNLLYNERAADLTTPIALHACDVQQFIMYTLFGRKSMYIPRWCSIQNITSITQMVVVVVEGVSWLDIKVSRPASWPHTNSLLVDQSIRVISPSLYGSSMEKELFMVPLTPSEVANTQPKNCTVDKPIAYAEDKDDLELNADLLLQTEDSFPRTLLLLSLTDLVGEGYPVPSQSCSEEKEYRGFVFSKEAYGKVNKSSALYALDCEMVMTSDCKLSLASICVVDERLNVVYSTLVKPEHVITDYLTKFSGITPARLKHITTTLEDVQRDLLELLPPDAILCGHSLNNDLVALKMYHPYVIDTSVCYNLKGMAHSKTGLKKLAAHFLRKEIQCGDSGHCPEEDAQTTMELVLLKLKLSYSFANALADGLMSTPLNFFKQKKDVENVDADLDTNTPKINKKFLVIESSQLTTPPLDNSLTNTPSVADSETGKQDGGVITKGNTSPAGNGGLSDNVTKATIDAEICQLLSFSPNTIPQLEINMFDMMGGSEDKKAAICTSCLQMRKPQNKSVSINESSKTKHIIADAKNALHSGTHFVYCNIEDKSSSGASNTLSKKRALRMDERIAELWDCMAPGGLLCLVASGNEKHHGGLMFKAKPLELELSQQNVASDSGTSDAVYLSMYNCT